MERPHKDEEELHMKTCFTSNEMEDTSSERDKLLPFGYWLVSNTNLVYRGLLLHQFKHRSKVTP